MHLAGMKVFAIPELLDIIGRFLDTSDRLHLPTTNQLCCQTISPLFWATLDHIDTVRAQRLLQSPDAQQAFNRGVLHIRHLMIQTSALVHFVDSMTSQPSYNNAPSAHAPTFDLEVTPSALLTPSTTLKRLRHRPYLQLDRLLNGFQNCHFPTLSQLLFHG